MFAIYNIQGRAFRNSLEQLQKVHQPHPTEDIAMHSDIAQDETLVIQGTDTTEATSNARSINAYRKMLHTNERTVIVHAYQIMSHPVQTILENTGLKTALDEFQQLNYQQMPVLSQQHQLIGMLTQRELLSHLLYSNSQTEPSNITVGQIIQPQVITVDPVSDVRRVAKVLYEYQLSALPVVNEQDHLVGIISKTDLLKAMIKDPPLSLWT